MADVAATLPLWSTTPGSNLPADATTIGAGLADNLQAIQAIVREWLAHKGSDIVSAATTDLGAVPGLFHDITGSTGPITSFGTVSAGIWKIIKFEGTPTLTHNATSLILPGAANIVAAVGDMLQATSEGSGNWRVNWYTRAAGLPVLASIIDAAGDLIVGTAADTVGRLAIGTARQILQVNAGATAAAWAAAITLATQQASTSGTSIDFTGIPAGVKRITVMFNEVSMTADGSVLLIQIGDSGGLETSGYQSSSCKLSNAAAIISGQNTGGFFVNTTSAVGDLLSGRYIFTLMDAATNTWAGSGNFGDHANVILCGGVKALSATLDRISAVVTVTGAFDAGAINIAYE